MKANIKYICFMLISTQLIKCSRMLIHLFDSFINTECTLDALHRIKSS